MEYSNIKMKNINLTHFLNILITMLYLLSAISLYIVVVNFLGTHADPKGDDIAFMRIAVTIHAYCYGTLFLAVVVKKIIGLSKKF